MYLEVQISNNDPQVYLLDKAELLIGSGPSCNIVIAVDEISRKHIKIIKELGVFYAIDQGSTNGSYSVGEQLIPGKRLELKEGTPVRLGSKVYMSLLTEKPVAEVQGLGSGKAGAGTADKTRIISLKDLKAQQAAQVKEKKKKQALRYERQERAKRKEKDKALINRAVRISIMLLLAGFALQFTWKVIKPRFAKKESIVKKIGIDRVKNMEEMDKNKKLQPESQPLEAPDTPAEPKASDP